jgi:tetratricopeptide (TPR) repeat protein
VDGLIEALGAVHRVGVIHRDVKPANVMIAPGGEPVLVDFSIATDEGSSDEAEERRGPELTRDDQPLGTPSFMAPEQLRRERTHRATDLWGFAKTVAFAAIGRPVDPVDAIPAFSRLGRTLSGVLARCLDEDAARRPTDATAIQETLARAVRRRSLTRVASGFAVALAAVVGIAVAARGSAAKEPGSIRFPEIRDETGDPHLAWIDDAAHESLASMLEEVTGLAVHWRREPRPGDATLTGNVTRRGDVVLALALKSPEGDLLAQADVRGAGGRRLPEGLARAAERFAAALGRPRRHATPGTTDLAALQALGRSHDALRARRWDEAARELDVASRRDPSFAMAQLSRYFTMQISGVAKWDAASDGVLARVREGRQRLSPSHRRLLDAIVEARYRPAEEGGLDRLRTFVRDRPDGATYRLLAQLARPVRDLHERILRDWVHDLPRDPEPHNQLGYLHLWGEGRDPTIAEREFRAYLDLAPGQANAHDSWGDFLREEGRYREALAAYRRALEIDPSFGVAAVHAVSAAILADDLQTAREELRRIDPAHSSDVGATVRASAAVSLLERDAPGAFATLDRMARTGPPVVRSHALEYAAILHALRGDRETATREAVEADRALRSEVGPRGGLRGLRAYVEGLVAYRRRDTDALERAENELHDLAATERGNLDLDQRRILLSTLVGLSRGVAPSPSEAMREIEPWWSPGGSWFLDSLERARFLARAGRTREADAAYTETIRRRRIGAVADTPEGAFEWYACVGEAAEAARAVGDLERATSLARGIRRR